MQATHLEKCQSLEHILLFRNDIVQNHDTCMQQVPPAKQVNLGFALNV